jgi:ATP-dependent phosphofructokinase / diphosphate-dependent phosphofructokinase
MNSEKKQKTIGILTAGGDCPGINAAIRGVGKTAILNYGMKVIGISDGFSGLINRDWNEMKEDQLSGILTLGGTILGTSREKPFKNKNGDPKEINKPDIIKKHYNELGLDCLVCIGGNGTQNTSYKLSKEGLNIIGIPKTIDNDVWGTDFTFGFDSAVNIATEAIDRLHTTANSHKRIMVMEVMGHDAGWLALYSGIAGGGDLILIPEVNYNLNIVTGYLRKRALHQKKYSIVVVAEGIETPKDQSAGAYIAEVIKKNLGIETRETKLGYIQRGGTPSPVDRLLATRYGALAAELIANEKYNCMVAIDNDKTKAIPLDEVGGKVKKVPPDHSLIRIGRQMGTCFGDCKQLI